jgi:EAL domain-containing protein (putative c-di-GMP-specific phosphodiesterase class I)
MGSDLRILFGDDAPLDTLLERPVLERDQRAIHPRIAPSEAEPRGDPGLAALVMLILEQFRRIDAVSDRRFSDQEWSDVGAVLTAHCRDLQLHPATIVAPDQEQRRLEAGLRSALQRDELSLRYQPQFEIQSGRACGVEALARWFRADGTTIAPSIFIPIAEQAGLIRALGVWSLQLACRNAAAWNDPGSRASPLAVNVSAHQICGDLSADIVHALESSGLPAERLELEITETVLVRDFDLAADCLAKCKRLGVRIALDDFGTGYSSLGYLSKLPIDRLKIDGSLIREMTSDSRDSTVVRAIIGLGRELGCTVLAEGVETEEQLRLLDLFGCEQVQGFLLAPPIPASEVGAMMSHRWGARERAAAAAELPIMDVSM